MRAWLLGLLGLIISALVVFGIMYSQKLIPLNGSSATTWINSVSAPDAQKDAQRASPSPQLASISSLGTPSPGTPSPLPTASNTPGLAPAGGQASTATNQNPDLAVDANGLSKATVIMATTDGVIKFKFYPNDAPKTVKRLIELINKGFYNGLTFHRVVPGFVIQGGDPVGNGTGGSGQKLDAEFNDRRHVEGAVAMARASDPNSADSQFYISLGTFPHLDHNYTVFGQVVEGLDIARKIKVGDKMLSLIIQ